MSDIATILKTLIDAPQQERMMVLAMTDALAEILRLRSELEQCQQAAFNAMEWQDIAPDRSNLPTDGSWFAINRAGEDEMEIGRYQPWKTHRYEEAGDGLFRKVPHIVSTWTHDNLYRATRFLPLPSPPKGDKP